MTVVVPFDPKTPKTRLAPALSAPERLAFARAMLRDVLEATRAADRSPVVLATDRIDVDAPVVVDDRPLSRAVDASLDDQSLPVAVVMADLPLATPPVLERLFAVEGDVVIAPGLGGGTNALLVRDDRFSVDYHGTSVRDHRALARDADLSVSHVDSFRLALDVDEPSEFVEILLHSDGHAADWLRDAGFGLETSAGRTRTARSSRPTPR